VCTILGAFLVPFRPKFFEESDDTKRRDYLFGFGGLLCAIFRVFF
jgi:hypothetical protein